MGIRKKSFFLLLLLLSLPPKSSASETTTETSVHVKNFVTRPSSWSAEADIQAHSVAGSASPWLGLAASYKIFDPLNLGLRGFLPLSQTVDKATYAIQGYARYRITHGTDTDLFLEPEFSENFYSLIPFSSYGFSIGALNHISPSLSVGIMGGIEVAQVVVDSVGVENESGLVVYPKVGVFTNFNF